MKDLLKWKERKKHLSWFIASPGFECLQGRRRTAKKCLPTEWKKKRQNRRLDKIKYFSGCEQKTPSRSGIFYNHSVGYSGQSYNPVKTFFWSQFNFNIAHRIIVIVR